VLIYPSRLPFAEPERPAYLLDNSRRHRFSATVGEFRSCEVELMGKEPQLSLIAERVCKQKSAWRRTCVHLAVRRS
jgi:hypothetical protein